jgi:hypothetical protein
VKTRFLQNLLFTNVNCTAATPREGSPREMSPRRQRNGGDGGKPQVGIYPEFHAQIDAGESAHNTAKAPKITCADAGESAQNAAAKVPKIYRPVPTRRRPSAACPLSLPCLPCRPCPPCPPCHPRRPREGKKQTERKNKKQIPHTRYAEHN